MSDPRWRSPSWVQPWLGRAVWVSTAVACACGGGGASTPPGHATQATSAPAPAPGTGAQPIRTREIPRTVAGPAAFDLAPSAEGAVLAWSPPRAQGGGIFVQRLDAHGVPSGGAERLAQTDAGGEVVELVVAATGDQLALAWIESNADESRTRALLVRPGEAAPPEPSRLSLGPANAAPGRSRLAIGAGRAERVRVLHATNAEDCGRGSSEPCTGYTFTELGATGPAGAQGEWMRVPAPCAATPPLLAAEGSALYYAVCSEAGGAPRTTVYGVDTENEYAHAAEVLPGCGPRGLLAPVRGGAWLVAQCGEGLRAAQVVAQSARQAAELALPAPEIVCADGAPALRAGSLTVALDQPLDALEAVLPSQLAPRGAVAVATGRALLVVAPEGESLALGRYECQSGVLKSEGGAAAAAAATAAPATASTNPGAGATGSVQAFGAPISAASEPDVGIAEVLADPERYAGATVTVRGVVSAVCQRRGCWMELAPGPEPGARGCRVVSEHHDWFVPRDAAGSTARVRGRVLVNVISAAQVAHMESEGGKFSDKLADGTARELRIVSSGVELASR